MYKAVSQRRGEYPGEQPMAWLHGKPENIPLPRAGVYLIRHLPTGKCYVGAAKNVERRCKEHSLGRGNVPGFSDFLKPFAGRNGEGQRYLLELVPLWFALNPAATTKKTAGTHFVEQAMVVAYNSIEHGWNQPHPDVALLSKRPQAIEKRKATEESVDTRANRSAGAVKRWSTRAATYTYNGETKSLAEWSRVTGIPYVTLYWRYKEGNPVL